MANYQIPPHVKQGFEKLLKSPQDKINRLVLALEGAPKGILPQQLADHLVKSKLYSSIDSPEIVAVIGSLFNLKEREKKSPVELIKDVYKSLKETGFSISEKKIKDNFLKILSIQNVSSIFKTYGLIMDYDKVFVDSRIITDIRPSFYDDLKAKADIAAIVHILKIEYHHGRMPHEDIYLTLDKDDLQKLKEQLIRAEEKEKSLRANFKNISFISSN